MMKENRFLILMYHGGLTGYPSEGRSSRQTVVTRQPRLLALNSAPAVMELDLAYLEQLGEFFKSIALRYIKPE